MDLPRMLNGLDLFSGIGGNTLALREWVRTVAYCEIDPHARAVLLSRMGDWSIRLAPIWDDVCTLRGDMFDVPVDIVIAGFPCQDISVAGRGAGLAGERSGLVREVFRLVGELAPTFVFLENVPAIRTRGADVVVSQLAALGYDCRWDCLSAFDVGAPHKRERWFLLAHRVRERLEVSQERDGSGPEIGGPRGDDPSLGFFRSVISDSCGELVREQSGRSGWSDGSGEALTGINGEKRGVAGPDGNSVTKSVRVVPACAVADAESCGRRQGDQDARRSSSRESSPPKRRGLTDGGGWWAAESDVGRVAHGVPARVDRLRGLGNAVVPAQAREAFRRLLFG